jgi:hypothetical protein
MHEKHPPAADGADETARRIRAAIAQVKPEVRRLPSDEAEKVLSAALGDDRRVYRDQDISRLVRQVQDPLWAVKHPVQSMREQRRR